MFKKVLVANRGEIAVRILMACEERGLATATVFSDADRTALHVRYADEAYYIGPAKPTESYLRMDKIIGVAKRCGADAIHPGYGFLAENADFAQAVIDAGLTFIGPPPEAIRLLGNKVAARRTMKKAGVPVVPGTDADVSDAEAIAEARNLGFPVMIKAAAGGGGKGMRLVSDPAELPRALAAARREAKGAFGDDTIYLEKIIPNARHIEVQLLADNYGNVVSLGERECSIQRRHQKMIEESPSPVVTQEMREQMGAVAVRAAKAAGYTNAGTVEFLVDPDMNFYFLEVNTRLQVEHPVTEVVTGVDIVKEQLAIAAGRRLRWKQEDIQLRGWAIEVRITSEDPYNNFLPAGGRITHLSRPTGPGVRIESGIYEGFVVSLYYDPLLAKMIVWGETRAEAILRMRRALREFRISGIKTTIPFHQRIMDSARFQAGHFDTRFLEDGGFSMGSVGNPEKEEVAALASALLADRESKERVTFRKMEGPAGKMSLWKQAALLGGLRR